MQLYRMLKKVLKKQTGWRGSIALLPWLCWVLQSVHSVCFISENDPDIQVQSVLSPNFEVAVCFLQIKRHGLAQNDKTLLI